MDSPDSAAPAARPGARTKIEGSGMLIALGSTPFFDAWSEEQLLELAGRCAFRRFAPGENLVVEGEPAKTLYVLVHGMLEIVISAKGRSGPREHLVAEKTAPYWFGENALFSEGRRSATVRAKDDVLVAEIPGSALETVPGLAAGLTITRVAAEKMIANTAEIAKARDALIEELETRAKIGAFIALTLVSSILYTAMLGTMSSLRQALGKSELITMPLALFCLAMIVVFMYESRYPAATFGLSLAGWRKNAVEGVLFSIPFLVLSVALRVGMLRLSGTMNAPLLAIEERPPNWQLIGIYAAFVPVQELLHRGVMMGFLERCLSGRSRTWIAIAISSAYFMIGHLYISQELSLITFFLGIFWGWMYARQRTLVGPSISHVLIGAWAFDIVGIPGIF